MAVREFTDASGREWRAWDIKPEEIHPVTKAEDYLADCYVTGWVVFETKTGDEKRRLCPWPIKWMDETERGLRRLLNMAEVVPPHRVREEREESGVTAAIAQQQQAADIVPTPEEPDVTDLEVVRTFRYPGGRFWTVCVVKHPEDGGPPVLRFQAGARWIDVRKWRKDWPDEPDDVLVDMLRRAAPRTPTSAPSAGMPRRRWTDQLEAATS